MNFIPIELLNLDIKINLKALTRDSEPYSILMYQHEGTLSASTQRIGNNTNVESLFTSFFSLAKENGREADLVLTPEYSCPWSSINDILNNVAKWPSAEKLWAIGCESITKEDLSKFEKACTEKNCILYYDKAILGSNKNFADPLVYLFKAIKDGNEKLVVLIQFKTKHMGVWGSPIERDNYIQGQNIYILKNSENQTINFFSLICSEAMNFYDSVTKTPIADWEEKPFLIFNPQFNPEPAHDNFTAFRKFVFQYANKEIISLNWHINSKIGTANMFRNSTSRSGFYIKSNEINFEDKARIKENHKLGIYYFNQGKARHAYILNSSIHVCRINLPHVMISDVQQEQSRRDGPVLISAYTTDNNNIFNVSLDIISDGHIEFITNGLGCENTFLVTPDNCIIEKESLICLTTGVVDERADRHWYKINNLESFLMDSKDTNRRITYIQGDPPLEKINEIKKYIDAINKLDAILKNSHNLPESIADLKGERIKLGYPRDASSEFYRYNIVSEDGSSVKATIVHLGLATQAEVEQVYEKLRKLFDANNKGRVVIYYTKGIEEKIRYDTTAGNFNNDEAFDSSSFRRNNP